GPAGDLTDTAPGWQHERLAFDCGADLGPSSVKDRVHVDAADGGGRLDVDVSRSRRHEQVREVVGEHEGFGAARRIAGEEAGEREGREGAMEEASHGAPETPRRAVRVTRDPTGSGGSRRPRETCSEAESNAAAPPLRSPRVV